MLTRQLGKTDMNITPIGLGTWAIGGASGPWGWGSQEDKASIHTIQRALDLGINWIDTAPIYGLGLSEEVVGKAIKERAEKPYIFTKCSLVWDEKGKHSNSMKAASIQREVEDSLRRLDVDVIDLYQIHWPRPDDEIEEGWSMMAKLQREGKVRAIGTSNFDVGQMRRAEKIAPMASLQPPYSLIHRGIEKEILPFCQSEQIGVIVYSPMASGLLSGTMTTERIKRLSNDDWRKEDPEFQELLLSRNLELASLLNEIGFVHNVPAGVIAISWTLGNPAVTGAIVGARRPEQIEDLLPAAELRLSESELERISQFMEVQVRS